LLQFHHSAAVVFPLRSAGRKLAAKCGAGHLALCREARCLVDRPPAHQNFTCVPGGRTRITLIRISRFPGPFASRPTSNVAGIFLPTFYSGVYEAAPLDSPSSPCTTRTSADQRRNPSLAHVAQHSMPRGFHPRPRNMFYYKSPLNTSPCASWTWVHSPRAEYYQHAVLGILRSGSNSERLSRTSVLYN
jgi:hypothetical protein